VLALLAEALCVEARCHRDPTPENTATLLALNDLQFDLSNRLFRVLSYEGPEPADAFSEGLFAKARELGCDKEWELAVRDATTTLVAWRLEDEADE
jgi:hypothetical protein